MDRLINNLPTEICEGYRKSKDSSSRIYESNETLGRLCNIYLVISDIK